MAQSIVFRAEIEILRKYYNNLNELEQDILNYEQSIEEYKKIFNMLAISTPKDIFPNSENIIYEIQNIIDDTFDSLSQETILLNKLYHLRDEVKYNNLDLKTLI